MDFDLAYKAYWPQIKTLCQQPAQRVPDLEPADIANEMLVCLWRAATTYDITKGTFGPYWWRMWRNRRIDLLGTYYAVSRVRAIPTDDLPEGAYDFDPFPVAPTDEPVAKAVWDYLAQGMTPADVQAELGISKRRYYDVINRLRTKEVWEMLT